MIKTSAWCCVALLVVACGGVGAGEESPDLEGSAGAAGGAGVPGASGTAAASASAGMPGAMPQGGGAGQSSSTAGNTTGGATSAGQSGGGAPSAGSGGTLSTAPSGPSTACKAWPAATGSTQKLKETQTVSKSFDGKLQRFVGDGLGDGAQGEEQLPLFVLESGATLENVIIGAPAADGIHCSGSCTLKNVWWEDVGEDAATLKGSSSSQVMNIDCGGAKQASDKVFQHNGPGTMKISNFFVESFGKLYRSCGNCSKQYERHAVFSGILAEGGKVLAGVNQNYGDSATFSNILAASSIVICERFTGNDSGAEPVSVGKGADGKACVYQSTDIDTP